MVIPPIWIKHALNVAVQRPHYANARKHLWPARLRDQQFHARHLFDGDVWSDKTREKWRDIPLVEWDPIFALIVLHN